MEWQTANYELLNLISNVIHIQSREKLQATLQKKKKRSQTWQVLSWPDIKSDTQLAIIFPQQFQAPKHRSTCLLFILLFFISDTQLWHLHLVKKYSIWMIKEIQDKVSLLQNSLKIKYLYKHYVFKKWPPQKSNIFL